jgi:hypothetical protein
LRGKCKKKTVKKFCELKKKTREKKQKLKGKLKESHTQVSGPFFHLNSDSVWKMKKTSIFGSLLNSIAKKSNNKTTDHTPGQYVIAPPSSGTSTDDRDRTEISPPPDIDARRFFANLDALKLASAAAKETPAKRRAPRVPLRRSLSNSELGGNAQVDDDSVITQSAILATSNTSDLLAKNSSTSARSAESAKNIATTAENKTTKGEQVNINEFDPFAPREEEELAKRPIAQPAAANRVSFAPKDFYLDDGLSRQNLDWGKIFEDPEDSNLTLPEDEADFSGVLGGRLAEPLIDIQTKRSQSTEIRYNEPRRAATFVTNGPPYPVLPQASTRNTQGEVIPFNQGPTNTAPIPRPRSLFNMNDTGRMVRDAAKRLPAVKSERGSFIRFLAAAELEEKRLRDIFIQDVHAESEFVLALLSKLDGQLYELIGLSPPSTYDEFRRTIVKGTTFIRPRALVEAEARVSIQQPTESPLGYLLRMENLRKEYIIATSLDGTSRALQATMLKAFDDHLVYWVPNAITDQTIGGQMRSRTFTSLQQMRNYLELERDRIASVEFVINQTQPKPAQSRNVFLAEFRPDPDSFSKEEVNRFIAEAMRTRREVEKPGTFTEGGTVMTELARAIAETIKEEFKAETNRRAAAWKERRTPPPARRVNFQNDLSAGNDWDGRNYSQNTGREMNFQNEWSNGNNWNGRNYGQNTNRRQNGSSNYRGSQNNNGYRARQWDNRGQILHSFTSHKPPTQKFKKKKDKSANSQPRKSPNSRVHISDSLSLGFSLSHSGFRSLMTCTVF